MAHALNGFSEWLAATPISMELQPITWVVPAVQTVHILAIAAVLSSVVMINLRVMGVSARTQSLAAVSTRFVPWVWSALAALAVSGSILIVIEPARPLTNPVFFLKLAMIVVVAALTLAMQRPLRADSLFWERSAANRVAARLLSAASLALWLGVICAGRWIAYTTKL